MKLTWQRVALPLKTPFTISRGTLHHQQCLIVALSAEGKTGYGEVTCNQYYQHTYESLEQSLSQLADLLADAECLLPQEFYSRCEEVIPEDRFALSAVDCAAYDLHGKITGMPTTQILGLPPEFTVRSSYTLGIASISQMIEKLRAEPDWPIYKIKLGTENDLEIVQALRQETAATIRVDANCAWSPEQTVEFSQALMELGVEFIEQPLPADAPAEQHRIVFEQSSLPIIADESCRTEGDVAHCRHLFHGINVKLCKCGGLTPAARMLRQARDWGMKTMVGCMVESTIGISAAAQLSPLLDYADLDGSVLLAAETAQGVRVSNGLVQPGSAHGNGVEPEACISSGSWFPARLHQVGNNSRIT